MKNKPMSVKSLKTYIDAKVSEELLLEKIDKLDKLLKTKENFDGICANHVLSAEHIAFFGHDLNHK